MNGRRLGRKGFLASLAGAVAAPGILRGGGRPAPLKLAVASDIHIAGDIEANMWEKALLAYRDWGADAVLVCGDRADWGVIPQLKRAAEIWFKVFPGGRRPDGSKVVNLLHYGDHDMCGYKYRSIRKCVETYPDVAEMDKVIIPLNNPKAVWEDCFQEEWTRLAHRNVKGWDFVLSHFTRGEPGNLKGNNVPGLAGFLASLDLPKDHPFFYSQHRIPRGTAGGKYIWGQDDGTVGGLFASRYPNCFAFCGHGHLTSADERALWQGAFTALEVPSLRRCGTGRGRENGSTCGDRPRDRPPVQMMAKLDNSRSQQGLFVTINAEGATIKRWHFGNDASMGHDWHVPFHAAGGKPYAPSYRAAHDPVPQFAADASVAVSAPKPLPDCLGKIHDMYVVSFPAVKSSATAPRADDYSVALEMKRGEVERVLMERRVFAPDYVKAEAAGPVTVSCNFPVADVPMDQEVRFTVRPFNAFARSGAPISTEWGVLRKKTSAISKTPKRG